MTFPPFDSVRLGPLETDVDLVTHLTLLLSGAIRRQVWLMFLDENAHPLPILMPSYLPARPGKNDTARLGAFFRGVGEDLETTTVVVTYERRGRNDLTAADRLWLRCLRDACLASGLNFRGPLLCHTDGVVQVAPDDYLT